MENVIGKSLLLSFSVIVTFIELLAVKVFGFCQSTCDPVDTRTSPFAPVSQSLSKSAPLRLRYLLVLSKRTLPSTVNPLNVPTDVMFVCAAV